MSIVLQKLEYTWSSIKLSLIKTWLIVVVRVFMDGYLLMNLEYEIYSLQLEFCKINKQNSKLKADSITQDSLMRLEILKLLN